MDDNRRILAFGCHPDDVEFMCAGTLALLRDRGYEIHIATVCGGEMGSMTLDKEEIREVRLKECEDAAKVLDAPYYWAGGEDIEVEFSHELRVQVGEVVRKAAPFLVFTHFPMDYMVDHEETSRLVRNACFSASMPNFKTPSAEPIDGGPHLYYWDAMEGKDILGRPTPVQFYIDISSTIETKAEMLRQHRSQREWLLAQHGMDQYVLHMKDLAAKRGEEIGVEFAEVFHQHLGHAYPQENILPDLLGDLCHVV